MPVTGQPSNVSLLRRELAEGLDCALACLLPGSQKLAARALGEAVRPDAAEHLVGGTELFARIGATVLATQPLAIQEASAGKMNDDTAAGESLNRLAVERIGRPIVTQQRARAGLIPRAHSVPLARVRSSSPANAAAAA